MNPSRVRTLVVDDEPLAREAMRLQLAETPDFDVIAECAGGEEAIVEIEAQRPDIVFLDIQMPGCDGFDVITRLDQAMPLTVFVTAYQQHALRAFDSYALDYVLKPVDPERFQTTLDRVRRRVAQRRAGHGNTELTNFVAELVGRQQRPERLVFKSMGHLVLLAPEELQWIEASGNYVKIHAEGKKYLVRDTIGRMERRLESDQFIRIHRSSIVNVNYIREVRSSDSTGDIEVLLCNGKDLPVGRSYRAAILQRVADFGGSES